MPIELSDSPSSEDSWFGPVKSTVLSSILSHRFKLLPDWLPGRPCHRFNKRNQAGITKQFGQMEKLSDSVAAFAAFWRVSKQIIRLFISLSKHIEWRIHFQNFDCCHKTLGLVFFQNFNPLVVFYEFFVSSWPFNLKKANWKRLLGDSPSKHLNCFYLARVPWSKHHKIMSDHIKFQVQAIQFCRKNYKCQKIGIEKKIDISNLGVDLKLRIVCCYCTCCKSLF